MKYSGTARRLQVLEAQADQEAAALYDTLLWSISDDELNAYIEAIGGIPEGLEALSDAELDRRAAGQKPTHQDYMRLYAWLEERRASIT